MTLSAAGAESIAAVLARGADVRRNEPFLLFESAEGSRLERSWRETAARAARMANLLTSLGVSPGDRVNVHLGNCPEFYDCWFGCALAGAVLVPTNPLLSRAELNYELTHARCVVGVTQPDLRTAVEEARPQSLREVVTPRDHGFEDELASRSDVFDASGRGPDDLAAILYTSGTTSRPKGVMVTNANYLYAGEVVAQHLRIRPDDRWLVVLPLFHANAQYYSTMSALVSGASIALTERFSASRWGRQAAGLRATIASLFAAPIRMILAQPPHPEDAANLLRAVIFSQNVTEQQLGAFEQRFQAPLLQLYGMTETIAPPTLNPLYGVRRNMTIGPPTLGSRLRIVDDTGRDVPPGRVGELLVGGVRGHTLMAGYLDDPEATERALGDGWLHTGDNVCADADAYLFFVDRAKDMIKRAGENVAAGEVEAVVNAHPSVFESAAVGLPDDMRDEAIKAFVVLRPGASVTSEGIIVWCRERMARFKVPSEVVFVDELPRTSVGKIRKDVLRGGRVGDEVSNTHLNAHSTEEKRLGDGG
jgi:carnitine-CoA ligase